MSSSSKPSPNAPNPDNITQPALPRSGFSVGHAHTQCWCDRNCIHRMICHVSPLSSNNLPRLVRFLRACIDGRVTTPQPGPPLEKIVEVVYVKKEFKKGEEEQEPKLYWFARYEVEEENGDGEARGRVEKGQGKKNEVEEQFHEILQSEYNQLGTIAEFDWVGRATMQCQSADDLSIRYEIFKKGKPVVPETPKPKRKRVESKAKKDATPKDSGKGRVESYIVL